MQMKRVVVTGAGGFVGQKLCDAILAKPDWQLIAIDMVLPDFLKNHDRVAAFETPFSDETMLSEVFSSPCDILFHLAAVPGGAAEQNPALSKTVNLDGTLTLFSKACENGHRPRIVYTSTIAVLGAPMPDVVDDNAPIVPAMTYGTHKAMIELALADLSRRKLADTVTVRLPGIVARPLAKSGLKSAFLSDVFHLLKAGQPYISPVSEQATMWLMSVNQCVNNLLNAAVLDSSQMPVSRVVTLPAVRTSMLELVREIASQTGASEELVSWKPDAALEEGFGKQPPLFTPAAEHAGFRHDGDITALVKNTLL